MVRISSKRLPFHALCVASVMMLYGAPAATDAPPPEATEALGGQVDESTLRSIDDELDDLSCYAKRFPPTH
jgi:hypothetical protein